MHQRARQDRRTMDNRRALVSRACRLIETLEPRRLLSVTPSIPNDPYLDYHFDKIDMPLAWGLSKGSEEVIVAVLDSGIDFKHPDLIGNIFTNSREIPGNGIDDDGNGFVDDVHGWDFINHDNDPQDGNGHGTHVSGIIGAVGNNGIGTSGITQNVKILPVKVLSDTGSGSFEAIINGIRYITQMKRAGYNIVVANASLGGYPFPAPAAMELAIKDLTDAGVLFVAAAGNESADIGGVSPLPAKLALNNPYFINVAATDENDQLAGFSNFNEWVVDVAAPGDMITSTWPVDLVAPPGTPEDEKIRPGDGYNTISGTSMAAPVVSGLIALMASYRPDASMAELKDALLKGAERVPSLEPFYSLPGKVQTAGRVNAYYSLLALDNTLVGQDANTRGNWAGAYGTGGYFIAGDSAEFAGNVAFHVDGNFFGLPTRIGPHNQSGLVSVAAPGSRVITHLATQDTMTLDFHFIDDQTHYVTLYMADVERQGRSQVLQLFKPEANHVMDATVVSNFQNGQYVTFKVNGQGQIRVINLAPGKTAVVDGVFIDSVPTGAKSYRGADTTTAGDWRSAYGSQGAMIVGQTVVPPPFATVQVDNAAPVVRQARGLDRRALQRIGDNAGIKGYYATTGTMLLDVAFTDGQAHELTLYMADYERAGRVQRVDVHDMGSGRLLDTRIIGDFSQGTYLTWELEGSVRIVVSRIHGPDAVVSGVFFDAPSSAPVQFYGIDSTTNGNWRGKYGSEAALIPGDTRAYPQSFGPIEGTWFGQVVNANSFDVRAPLSVNSLIGARTASYMATQTQMRFNFDFGAGVARRVAFYVADYERFNRSQRFEVFDPTTGELLVSQDISDFGRTGKYVVFELTGQAQVRVTRLGGPSAVVSGIFIE